MTERELNEFLKRGKNKLTEAETLNLYFREMIACSYSRGVTKLVTL